LPLGALVRLLLAAAGLSSAAAAAAASAGATPGKAAKPLEKETNDALRLEAGCRGCFPDNRKECVKDLWNRCCGQEIACHEYHCMEDVLGKLQANTKVRARVDFESDDQEKTTISKGMSGRVLRIDGEGDALIKFSRDEYDDEVVKHWVSRTSVWEHLELPEKVHRHRAAKVVKCLDQCTLDISCGMMELQSKPKKMRQYHSCMTKCKVEECQTNEDCKPFFDAYAQCKQQTSTSGVCQPPSKKSAATAEL